MSPPTADTRAKTLIRDGGARLKAGDTEGALAAYKEACALAPEDAGARNALGLMLKNAGRPDEAVDCLQKVASDFPRYPQIAYNLGNALTAARRAEEAVTAFERAIALDPNHFKARVHLAFARLTLGQFREGFAAYEQRFKAPGFPPPVCLPQGPAWAGEDLNGPGGGGRILLISEQGFGDTVQFIRWAPMVKARGGTVIAACQPPMAELLRGQPGIDEVLLRTDPHAPIETAFDAHICLMSLPHVFETTPETIPADVPYLRVPPEAEARAADWGLGGPGGGPGGGFKAGLVWRAGHMDLNTAQKSVPPEVLPALLDTPGVRWFGLDKRAEGDPRPEADLGAEVTDLGPRIENFADAAAAAAAMDVIVTPDTAAAHLAGALGKRVFVLLPYAPDWRWRLKDETSPWYPSARLFRQETPGDWSAPVAACRAALGEAAAGFRDDG
ncbi:MAG: tetratricopeptide repeat protein [Rhodospirillales bacterium]